MNDRRERTTSAVPVSLVITSRKGGQPLLDCIAAFSQAGDDGLQVIVAECADPRWASAVGARFSGVKVLHFDERRTTPELRAAGLLASQTDIVAMTTDHCRPGEGWLQAVRRAHEGGRAAAVGGAVEYGSDGRLLNWAVFFCEYGRYMLPFGAGVTADLPAQNVSYTRMAIQAFSDLLAPATWEPLWHWRLVERGHTLICDPFIVVRLWKQYALRQFLAERFHYSRSFAADRLAKRSLMIRLGYAAGTLLLPPVLLWRIVRPVLEKRRHRLTLACSVPYLVLFTVMWVLGECAGAVAGPGRSADRID